MVAPRFREVVRRLPPDFVAEVRRDPDVVDWLIGVTENQQTKDQYVRAVAKFLLWTGWTVMDLWRIKGEALREGEPMSEVETKIKLFMEALRAEKYAGKYRALTLAALASLLNSKGFTLKRKLVRINAPPKLEMRVPDQAEVQRFIEYASGLEKKLLYTMLTDTPCRPRIHVALRWNWLEAKWWEKEVAHVTLPREFRHLPRIPEDAERPRPRHGEILQQTERREPAKHLPKQNLPSPLANHTTRPRRSQNPTRGTRESEVPDANPTGRKRTEDHANTKDQPVRNYTECT